MVVTELLRAGKSVRYFTNNSAARPIQVSAFLNHLGVPCKQDWVFTTGVLAADQCRERGYERVLLVGEEAFAQTLRDKGIEPTNERPDAVVVGICRTISYELLDRAAAAIRDGLPFLATNRDATYPLESGRLQPGAGAIVAAIEVASGMEPEVLGKPNPALARLAIESAGTEADQTVVVGDRLDTDIACGQAAGCQTYLVLTGVETQLDAGQAGGPDLRGLLSLQ